MLIEILMKKVLIFLVLIILPGLVNCQETEELKQLNLSATSGSSFILNSSELELITSTSLSSFRSRFSYNTESVAGINVYRSSSSVSSFFTNLGVSEQNIIDFGFGVEYARSRFDEDANSSGRKVYSNDGLSVGSFSNITYRLRWAPLAVAPEFLISVNGKIPLRKGETAQKLSSEKYFAGLGLSYFGPVGFNDYFYVQGNFDYGFNHNREYEQYSFSSEVPANQNVSLSAYYIYNSPIPSLYLLPGISYSGTFQNSIRGNNFLQRTHSVLLNWIVQFQINDTIAITYQQSYPSLFFKSHIPSIEFERSSLAVSSLSLRFLFDTTESMLIDKYLN